MGHGHIPKNAGLTKFVLREINLRLFVFLKCWGRNREICITRLSTFLTELCPQPFITLHCQSCLKVTYSTITKWILGCDSNPGLGLHTINFYNIFPVLTSLLNKYLQKSCQNNPTKAHMFLFDIDTAFWPVQISQAGQESETHVSENDCETEIFCTLRGYFFNTP